MVHSMARSGRCTLSAFMTPLLMLRCTDQASAPCSSKQQYENCAGASKAKPIPRGDLGMVLSECWCGQGIFVTEDDYVLEGPNMNLGILTYDNEFIVSPCPAKA